MYEYIIREFANQWGTSEQQSVEAFLGEINALGRDGWEAVGLAPRTHYDHGGGQGGWDSFSFVVLFKRLLIPDT